MTSEEAGVGLANPRSPRVSRISLDLSLDLSLNHSLNLSRNPSLSHRLRAARPRLLTDWPEPCSAVVTQEEEMETG